MRSYEDTCGDRVEVSPANPEELNRLVRSLPEDFRRTIKVSVPNEKYPDLEGVIVEKMNGDVLYYLPYHPLIITPYRSP